MTWYDTGTISLTNGNTTVTGAGTDFISGAQIGEALYAPDGNLYEIQSITSATVLVLADNYLGSTVSGQDYKIIPTQSLVADLAGQVTDLITDYSDVKDGAGAGKFNDGTVTSPAITFEQDQNNGLYRIGSDNYAMSAGGTKQIDISTTDVELNYSGSKKLATTSTGVDVTGTVTADALTVAPDANRDMSITGYGTYSMLLSNSTADSGGIVGVRSNGGFSVESTGAGVNVFKALGNGDVHFYEDTGTTAKMVWSSSAESLGIGTASPTKALSIHSYADKAAFTQTNTANSQKLEMGNAYSLYTGASGGHSAIASNSVLAFATADAERARLDSSGNLLVGQTTPSNITAGMYVRPSSSSGIIADGAGALTLGRLNSDGAIASFLKDGTTVGSIGTNLSRVHIGSDDCRLFFDAGSTNAVWPWADAATSSGDADNTIDLGDSANRFKNLYLSGGVYLGGTGSANKLDDYEEGTWTPLMTFDESSTGITYSRNQGTYTKIGNRVFFELQMVLTNKGTDTGIMRISLPFAVSDEFAATGHEASCSLGLAINIGTSSNYRPTIYNAKIEILDGANSRGITDSSIGNTANVRISGQYRTNE